MACKDTSEWNATERGKLSRSKSILSCEPVRRSSKKSSSVCDEPVSRPVEQLSSLLVHSLDDDEFRNMLSLAAEPQYCKSVENTGDVSLETGLILHEMQRVAQHKQHIEDLESEHRNGTVTAFINHSTLSSINPSDAALEQERDAEGDGGMRDNEGDCWMLLDEEVHRDNDSPPAQGHTVNSALSDSQRKDCTVIEMCELESHWEETADKQTTPSCIAYIDEDCEEKGVQQDSAGVCRVSTYKQGNVVQELHALNESERDAGQSDGFTQDRHGLHSHENPFPYTWGELRVRNNKEHSYEMNLLHEAPSNNNHESLCGSSRVLEHNLQPAHFNHEEQFAVNYLQPTQHTYLTPLDAQPQHNQLPLSTIQPPDKCALARKRKEKRKAKQQENVYVVQHTAGYMGDLSPDEIVRRIEGDHKSSHPPTNKELSQEHVLTKSSKDRTTLKHKRSTAANKVYKRNVNTNKHNSVSENLGNEQEEYLSPEEDGTVSQMSVCVSDRMTQCVDCNPCGELLLDGANYIADDEPLPSQVLARDTDFITVKSKKKGVPISCCDTRAAHSSPQHKNRPLLLVDLIQDNTQLKTKKHANHCPHAPFSNSLSSHHKGGRVETGLKEVDKPELAGDAMTNSAHDKMPRSWAEIARSRSETVSSSQCKPIANGHCEPSCSESALEGISFFYDPNEPTALLCPVSPLHEHMEHFSSDSFNTTHTDAVVMSEDSPLHFSAQLHERNVVLQLEGGKTMRLPAMGMHASTVVVHDKQHLLLVEQLSTHWTAFGHRGIAPTRYRDVHCSETTP